jgi:glutamyl/glutaminyl-tRNA synthetase
LLAHVEPFFHFQNSVDDHIHLISHILILSYTIIYIYIYTVNAISI